VAFCRFVRANTAAIEAIKMKADVVSKHNCTVGNILVRSSDSVETSQVLLTLS